MHELDDNTLLRQYTEQNSETAFAALVARHVDKVYSVALRHTHNAHAAEEITQAVFVILAKKSGRLGGKVILAGWLYETARLTALTYTRSEIRRARREQEAHMQTTLNDNNPEVWPHIAPLLDDALAGLSAADRHAIVLRYFDGKSLGEVGAALGASEDAAKKRVTRAVEKLRGYFTKRGVTLTAAVLTAAISANSVQAAPLGLAATVTATAAKGAAVSGSTLTLIKGALKVMAWTKAKMAIVVGVGVLLAAGTTTVLVKEASVPNLDVEQYFKTIGIPMTNGTWADFDKIPPNLFVLRKTHYADFHTPNWINGTSSKDRAIGRNQDLSNLMKSAYGFYFPHARGTGVVLPANVPQDGYDFLTTGPEALKKLQAEIIRQLDYTARIETRDTEVYLLKLINTNAPGLKLSNGHREQKDLYDWPEMSPDVLAFFLESHLDFPIVNQTGLKDLYDAKIVGFTWDYTHEDQSRANLRQAIRDQLGLELIKTNLPIEMLVVEKVK
jgi:uncharacterized protein (TIGR03435 family)